MSPRTAPAVRILAGRWKGRRLEAPSAARPTSGRARQALFDLLAERLPGARVLDLYAGTGAVGLEAVSRGAASAVLVEPDAAPLRRSVARLGAEEPEVCLISRPASAAVEELIGRGDRFDIVFADPPYALSLRGGELQRVAEVLAHDGVLALQADAGREAAPISGLSLREHRAYGRNVFFFFQPSGGGVSR